MRRKQIQTYEQYEAEFRTAIQRADAERRMKELRSLSTVDSETAGFGELCVWIIVGILGLGALGYIFGVI